MQNPPPPPSPKPSLGLVRKVSRLGPGLAAGAGPLVWELVSLPLMLVAIKRVEGRVSHVSQIADETGQRNSQTLWPTSTPVFEQQK